MPTSPMSREMGVDPVSTRCRAGRAYDDVGFSMKAQRVVMPVTSRQSWTVVDDGFAVVCPAERYLAHLAGIERSPNTVSLLRLSSMTNPWIFYPASLAGSLLNQDKENQHVHTVPNHWLEALG